MSATNPRIEGGRYSASDPAFDGEAFAGNADVTFSKHTRGIYIASDGDLKVDMLGIDGAAGAALTFVGVKGGTVLPIAATKVYDSGTTVSGIALF